MPITTRSGVSFESLRRFGAAFAVVALSATGCGGAGAAGPAAAAGADGAPAGEVTVGAAAPEIKAELVTGTGPSTLGQARGKVTILDFWATHCGPCRTSFPEYQKLVDQFNGQVQVIAISTDDPEDVGSDALVEFAQQTGVKFAVVWDKTRETASKYNPPNLPTSYVIDQEGVLRHVHAAYVTGEEQKIASEVKALLGQ